MHAAPAFRPIRPRTAAYPVIADPFASLRVAEVSDPTTSTPKFLDRVRWHLRIKRYSIRTERAYLDWIRRFIFFHGKRHPAEMGEEEIAAFLSHLAIERHVAASTQNQAFNALLFLYQQVLDRKLTYIPASSAFGARLVCPLSSREPKFAPS